LVPPILTFSFLPPEVEVGVVTVGGV